MTRRAEAIERFDRKRRRRILAAKILLATAALWLIVPRLAPLINLIRAAGPFAAAFLLVLLAWATAFTIELIIFFAVSWDDFRDLAFASLRASSHAMWFAPGVLLLSTPSVVARLLGLALVANTTRLLLSRNAPQRLAPIAAAPANPPRRYPFLRYGSARDLSFRNQTLPAVFGALAVQVGICCLWTAHPLAGAALTAGGVALWTGIFIARGFLQRRTPGRSHWKLGFVLTLLLTTFLSALQIQIQDAMAAAKAGDAGLFATLDRVWQNLESPADLETMPVDRPPAKLAKGLPVRPKNLSAARPIRAGGAFLVPGVIVRPDVRKSRTFLVWMPPGAKRAASVAIERTLTFPFTGEYQIYPAASARRDHDWAIERGSLLENLYETEGGGALQTVASQSLVPPVDLANCGKLLVLITSAEDRPFAASLELLKASGGSVQLSEEIGGLDRHSDEVLEFELPAGPLLVTSLRVAFHSIPRQGPQSLHIDVHRFTLVPRAN